MNQPQFNIWGGGSLDVVGNQTALGGAPAFISKNKQGFMHPVSTLAICSLPYPASQGQLPPSPAFYFGTAEISRGSQSRVTSRAGIDSPCGKQKKSRRSALRGLAATPSLLLPAFNFFWG